MLGGQSLSSLALFSKFCSALLPEVEKYRAIAVVKDGLRSVKSICGTF